MAVRAILFDLGNTLVSYYAPTEFPAVLRDCLRECTSALGWPPHVERDERLLTDGLALNRERADWSVWRLEDRLLQLFAGHEGMSDQTIERLVACFLKPIFARATIDPAALFVLGSLRRSGIRTGIVSNTPWGSPAAAWRRELSRHGLLDAVDVAVFCMDVGWRKPHPAPFYKALAWLDVDATEAWFVGDDPRWDLVGARNAGLRPILLGSPLQRSASEEVFLPGLRDVIELAATAAT